MSARAANLYQITSPHFVAGIETAEGVVIHTAPIVAYMHGWWVGRVTGYCQKKGWALAPLKVYVAE